MSFVSGVAELVRKDLRAEWRTKEVLSSSILFAIIALTVINFGFEPGRFQVRDAGAGVLWTAFLFAALLGMNRLFQAERERGGIEGLMLCPIDRTSLYVAKCASLFLLLSATATTTILFFILFFNVRIGGALPLLLVVALLGTLGLSALGTSFAAMASKTAAREVLLPVLLIPIAVPLLIAAVKCTSAVLAGEGLGAAGSWLQLLVAFDAIFLAAGYLTFPAILEE